MKVSKRKFFNRILSETGCEENGNDTPQTDNNVQHNEKALFYSLVDVMFGVHCWYGRFTAAVT